jgi:hypothetical protein
VQALKQYQLLFKDFRQEHSQKFEENENQAPREADIDWECAIDQICIGLLSTKSG